MPFLRYGNTRMNTLLYHFGGLGDFITVLPAIAFWKLVHTGSVTLLGKPAFGALAKDAGYVDTVMDADSGSRMFLFRHNSDESKLRQFFTPFDAMLLFAAPGSPLVDNARACARATVLCQPPFPATRTPAVDYHLSLVTEVSSLTVRQRTPAITIPGNAGGPLLTGIRSGGSAPTVAIHPGSGGTLKNWPFGDFLDVAGRLRDAGGALLWITGPADNTPEIPPGDLHMADRPLPECAAILSRCAAFLGNDGGMTHLAAASGCPTVALFGPSDPAVWAPRGNGPVSIIHHPTECAPCHVMPNASSVCNGECMRRIRPDEVFAAVEGVMKR
ncbi:MAG: glycosyltransferase family 9 protein [Chitinispirillaceae bacterium]|nr:glycosyltransferase family 9 protein [Chitinispirillaceae bacterium]